MIIAEELFARKGAVKLAVWRKHPISQSDHPAVVLVHGSSTSARPTFDLAVPGKTEYSMMDWFAARGFDCWAMDHEGYGHSTVTQSNSDVRCGVEDLRHLMPLIEERTGRRRGARSAKRSSKASLRGTTQGCTSRKSPRPAPQRS